VTTIKRVAVIGCGTVGASWAALFLGHGLDVAAYDPSPGAEDRLQSFVDHALDQLAELGTREKGELRFSGDLTDVLGAADFVQENVPEDEALKRRMLADIDALTTEGVIVPAARRPFCGAVSLRSARHRTGSSSRIPSIRHTLFRSWSSSARTKALFSRRPSSIGPWVAGLLS